MTELTEMQPRRQIPLCFVMGFAVETKIATTAQNSRNRMFSAMKQPANSSRVFHITKPAKCTYIITAVSDSRRNRRIKAKHRLLKTKI